MGLLQRVAWCSSETWIQAGIHKEINHEAISNLCTCAFLHTQTHTHRHTPVPLSEPKLIHSLFQEMEVLEVHQKDFHLSYYAFFQCVKLNGDILSMQSVTGASFETATCLKIWRPYYHHYSEKPNHISLLSDRMARVLQLCSLVWEQPEQPHSAGSLVPSSVCFYSDRWGRVRRMWCSCGLIS